MEDLAYIFEYNKTTGVTKSMMFKSTSVENGNYQFSSLGFHNDIDGGANFYPGWTNREGNIWVSAKDPIEFRKENGNVFDTTNIHENEKARTMLRNFLKDLKEDDNPVLIVVYLKQE